MINVNELDTTRSSAAFELLESHVFCRDHHASQRRSLIWHVSLRLAVDVAILVICARLIVLAQEFQTMPYDVLSLGIVALLWLTILNLRGFYNLKVVYPFHQLAYELLKVLGLTIVSASALFYLFPSLALPRSVHWNVALLSYLGLLGWRTLSNALLPVSEAKHRVIVVGSGSLAERLQAETRINPRQGFEIVGFVDEGAGLQEAAIGVPLLGSQESLSALSRHYQVDSIVVAHGQAVPERTMKAVADCMEQGCQIMDISRFYERVSGRIPVLHISHSWFLFELNEANRGLYTIAKRSIDIFVAIVGLCVTLVILPIIALLIKSDSPGPIFYSQVRVGKNGDRFKIYKFRTMVVDAEKNGAVWARKHDNRVTPVGNFLRRTRLDELPQLYNVLRGDMSMVGPRPERPEFVEQLAAQIPFFNRRHMVLPGLTGWAQVKFPYGASVDDALEKLHFDLFYIKNRSIFLDVEILFRTISVVLNRRGSR